MIVSECSNVVSDVLPFSSSLAGERNTFGNDVVVLDYRFPYGCARSLRFEAESFRFPEGLVGLPTLLPVLPWPFLPFDRILIPPFSRYFGCSGRPLCRAKRRGPKNGPVIEMEVVPEGISGIDPAAAATRVETGAARNGVSAERQGFIR